MRFKGYIWLVGLFLWLAGAAGACPTPQKVQQLLRNLTPGNLKILSVRPSAVKGLCEVTLQQGTRKGVTYIDESGRYLVAGRIIEIAKRRDLTGERISELNRVKLTPQQVQKLRQYVAFSAGKGPEVFFIIDPDCPFCKKAERILWQLIQENKVRVNVVFFPLEQLHPRAKQKAIALICEKKGFEDLVAGYQGTKECREGKDKVEEGARFVKSLGIRGTPTYVFPSGLTHSGVLSREQLLKLLKNAS